MYAQEPSDVMIENWEHVQNGIWGLKDLGFET